ncbi:MAG TPA: hypothetical protein RMH99_16800 [Sandaracinaceae bacterium LLY-WYZ-13_1]|nr:hypothetical protein [Sandaracinaceae bacterium LLY-WYZ-13_1]
MPRWVRRLGFFAVLASAAVVFMTVGRPEACASIWTWEHQERACCRLASTARWQSPEGDCCGFYALEERDPAATPVPLAVAPADWVRLSPVLDAVEPAAARWLDADRSVPERPPDRAHATIVMLL